MPDTCGPSSETESRTASLQSSLESRLRANLDVNGSPEYGLIWKHWDMLSGPPICALRASARRTSVSVSTGELIGWPTPRGPHGCGPSDGVTRGVTPEGAAQSCIPPAGWPTPTAPTKTEGHQAGNNRFTTKTSDLVGWPSPKSSNGTGAGQRGTGGLNLQTAVQLAGWATTTTRDWKDGEYQPNVPINCLLGRQVWLSGETSMSSPAATEKRGVLSPEHSRWLMGFPSGWTSFAVTETP